MERKHFAAFDAIRFFAFLMVFLCHLPLMDFPFFSFLNHHGGTGVKLFFVLSGFLITYILLHEKINTGTIRLKNFYFRRVLRIWPLFYLMILFAYSSSYILQLLHIPSNDLGYTPDWRYSFTFLENYKMMAENNFPNGAPLRVMWSLCVEEHFYIIWGIVLFLIPVKKVPYIAIAFSLVSIGVKYIYSKWGVNTNDLFSNFDTFGMGALAAYCFITRSINFSLNLKIFIVLLSICLILFPSILFNINSDDPILSAIYSLLFSLLILSLATNGDVKEYRNPYLRLLTELGKLTYGMYLFHTILILLFMKGMVKINFSLAEPFHAVLFSIVTFVCTSIGAYLSYHYFEKIFLNLKNRFESYPNEKDVLLRSN